MRTEGAPSGVAVATATASGTATWAWASRYHAANWSIGFAATSLSRSSTCSLTALSSADDGALRVGQGALGERADEHQHQAGGEDQEDRQANARVEVLLEGAVDCQRHGLRPARQVAGEHDRRPELAEGPRPGHDRAAQENRRRQRQDHVAKGAPTACAVERRRFGDLARYGPEPTDGRAHVERRGDEELGDHD